MDIKRVLIGLSIIVTLLWVLYIYIGVIDYDGRGRHIKIRGGVNGSLVLVTWWGLLYTGFWVARGSAEHTFILGFSALAFIGVFFFAWGLFSLSEGGIESYMLGGSLMLAAGTGILVAAVLYYRQRAQQVLQPPDKQ